MRERILLLLFSLPFLGVGLWMSWSIGSSLYDASKMRGWVPVEARLQASGYETHDGDDSDTYEAYALYDYEYAGQHYSNDRVGISGGADNIGDYQRETGLRLQRALSRHQPITVYVDPGKPSASVIDRQPRWEMIGFKSIFLIVFGGAGAAMFAYGLLARKSPDDGQGETTNSPWLLNAAWQSDSVLSNSKKAVYGAWAFAVVWNAISAPLPLVAWREVVEKQNYMVLLGLLFPAVGLLLVGWAIRRTLEWRRLGPAPVLLDPYPGAIGGHVGGTMDLRLPFDPGVSFSLTLTSLRSYMSGSGKNRSRREKATWQDSRLAHAEPSARGTRLSFQFDVPRDLDASDSVRNKSEYHIWRLNLHADLPGTDIDRDYDIPVYPTGARSRRLPSRVVETVRIRQEQLDDAAVRRRLRVSEDYAGKEIYFPAGRNAGGAAVALVFGVAFATAGWFLATSEGERLFGAIFAGIGSLVALGSLYAGLNSLRITAGATEITSERRLVGIPVRRRSIRRIDFAGFRRKRSGRTQSGTRHVVYYTVYADDRNGKSIVIGEGFKGDSQAQAAMHWLARELGLDAHKYGREKQDEAAGPGTGEGVNVLAEDH